MRFSGTFEININSFSRPIGGKRSQMECWIFCRPDGMLDFRRPDGMLDSRRPDRMLDFRRPDGIFLY